MEKILRRQEKRQAHQHGDVAVELVCDVVGVEECLCEEDHEDGSGRGEEQARSPDELVSLLPRGYESDEGEGEQSHKKSADSQNCLHD